MKNSNSNPHIPELGEILKFLLDVFDIRRDGNPLTHKQVERLAKGRDLSREKIEQVARSVLDAIWHEASAQTLPLGKTGEILDQWSKSPGRFAGLPVDENGVASLAKDQLLRDLIEFCWRHQFVLAGLADCKNSRIALQYWLSGFVIPYFSSTLVDYHFTENNPESGMPGGRLWYMPTFESSPDSVPPIRIIMPSQQVLAWWEDLLGRSLENLADKLCGASSDPDNARRQIAAWKNDAKPPESETIRRWTNQTWDYQGTFHDNPGLTLSERWGKCREFLQGKGMMQESDWIDGTENSKDDPIRALGDKYRGERLEQEIPPFREFSFTRFFSSPDPVAEGLPVERLIEKVAMRWRTPTLRELHSRLMLGRAMTVVWSQCYKALGPECAFKLGHWTTCSYNHFMELCLKSDKLSAQESMRIHCQTVERADPAFYPIAAMLDEGYWLGLPGYLRKFIRDEVVYK